jgi:CHASE3 domain sensor protein
LAAAELASSMKQMKQTVAALDAAGQKQQIVQFLQKLGEKEKEPALYRLEPAIERVAKSPQGPKLRSEINAVLDAMVENTTGRERENIQRWIQEKNLRQ